MGHNNITDAQLEALFVKYGIKIYSQEEKKFLGIVWKKYWTMIFGETITIAKDKEHLEEFHSEAMEDLLCIRMIEKLAKKYWVQIAYGFIDKKISITLVDKKTQVVIASTSVYELLPTLILYIDTYGGKF